MPAKATKRSCAALEEAASASAQPVKSLRKQSSAAAKTSKGSTPAAAINSQLEAQLSIVAGAVGKAPDVPPFVASMLTRMMPKSLGEPEKDRHRHQQRVVDMVGLSLKRSEAAMRNDVQTAKDCVDAATVELSTLKDNVSTAEASLAEQQEAHCTAMAQHAEDGASLRARETSLSGAKEEARKVDLRARERRKNKSLLSDALEKAVTPWKAGTLENSSALEWSSQMSVIQERLKFDDSVVVAAKSVLAKDADEARTAFDSIVMEELETRIGQELQIIEVEVRTADVEEQEQAALVKTAEAERDQAREVERASSESAASWQTSVRNAEAKLEAARCKVKNVSLDICLKSSTLKAANDKLDSFLKGPRHAFEMLQKQGVNQSP